MLAVIPAGVTYFLSSPLPFPSAFDRYECKQNQDLPLKEL
jgi:hypothetical protein